MRRKWRTWGKPQYTQEKYTKSVFLTVTRVRAVWSILNGPEFVSSTSPLRWAGVKAHMNDVVDQTRAKERKMTKSSRHWGDGPHVFFPFLITLWSPSDCCFNSRMLFGWFGPLSEVQCESERNQMKGRNVSAFPAKQNPVSHTIVMFKHFEFDLTLFYCFWCNHITFPAHTDNTDNWTLWLS